MPLTAKMLMAAALGMMALGSMVAYSSYQRQMPSAGAQNGATTSGRVRPSADDPLQTPPSWRRWPPLTDF